MTTKHRNNKQIECAKKREEFLSDKSLHVLPISVVAEKLGIRQNTLNTWRRVAGIATPLTAKQIARKELSAKILADPDISNKRATVPIPVIAKRYGMTEYAISKLFSESGITPYGSMSEKPEQRTPKPRPRLPLPPDVIEAAHMLESWQRPVGLHEHVMELRK